MTTEPFSSIKTPNPQFQSLDSNFLDELSAEFRKSEVKQREAGRGFKVDYIDIPTTINRLNSVCGTSWNWKILSSEITPVDDGRYLAVVRGSIEVSFSEGLVERAGVGSDIDKDPDKAIKTADAEALKKAGHKYGIALYLWSEEKREEIAEFRRTIENCSIPDMQRLLYERYKDETGKETIVPTDISRHFGVKENSLKNRQVLLHLLDA